MSSPSGREQPPEPAQLVGEDPVAVAERELAPRYWDRVRLFALRRVRDPAAAEDMAQEVIRLVAAAIRAGRVDDLAALPGFVFRTAHHLCLQRFRSTSREARALDRFGAEAPTEAAGPDPLVALIGEERRGAVRRAVDALPAADRHLLGLLYFDGVGSATAAERLGVTPEALRVRKHRALRRLAELLDGAREDVTP
jgi:RNA polymerase sigma-70 factor (ECF subfamily)